MRLWHSVLYANKQFSFAYSAIQMYHDTQYTSPDQDRPLVKRVKSKSTIVTLKQQKFKTQAFYLHFTLNKHMKVAKFQNEERTTEKSTEPFQVTDEKHQN